MKSYCAYCCKPYEAKNMGQEFCTRECHDAFLKADRAWKKKAKYKEMNHIPGARAVLGGYQAVNRGLSDMAPWE